MRTASLLALILLAAAAPTAIAQTAVAQPASTAKMTKAQIAAAELQKTVDQLTQSNRDLLDLLKKQQAVLEDMQFDRRLQSRQIVSLEERLEESISENTQLQNKVAKLEEDAAIRPPAAPAPVAPVAGPTTNGAPNVADVPPVPAPPAVPQSYLPQAPTDGEPGTLWWHRLFTLKGDDSRKTDLFQIQSKTWRVVWHNQDRPGKEYANTSALFLNAFPKDDTIPYKVCAKLGSGGDVTILQGAGTYYLKVEASGGSWELAVEEYR